MKKNNSSIFRNGILLGAGMIVAFLVFAAVTNSSNASTQNTAVSTPLANAASNGDRQVVKVTMQGYQYVFSNPEFKKGTPVRLEFDMSTIYGCMRSINIPAFSIRKTVSEANNVIEFTPDKAGTFNIACSMNMGRGTFKVLESDGTQSAYVEQKPAAPAGGGCGCGGGGAGTCGTK